MLCKCGKPKWHWSHNTTHPVVRNQSSAHEFVPVGSVLVRKGDFIGGDEGEPYFADETYWAEPGMPEIPVAVYYGDEENVYEYDDELTSEFNNVNPSLDRIFEGVS